MALLSVLRHAGPEESFHFYILDNKISSAHKQKIDSLHKQYAFEVTYIPLDEKWLAGCDPKHLSLSTFGRYFIPKFIPHDKVLYLDCDIMVCQSLLPLWQTDLGDSYLAGVPDYGAIHREDLTKRFGADFDPLSYVNAGVLLINNKKWLQDNICSQLLDYSVANATVLRYADQDAINFICRKAKKLLPERYNIQPQSYKPDLYENLPVATRMAQERENVVIRHFHPWVKNAFSPKREEYLALMRQSPWADWLPQDDPKWLAWTKAILRYAWRHPFFFLSARFYKRLSARGAQCLFIEG